MTNKIVYYYDALCGWCYGLTDVMAEMLAKHKSSFDFEIVSGGLFLGTRVGYVNDVAGYIKDGAYLQVEQTTGVKFGDGFINGALKTNNMLLDSIYPAVAMVIFREYFPERAMEYGSSLLKAFYRDGISSDDLKGYQEIIDGWGLTIPDFLEKMSDSNYLHKAKEEFKSASNKGIKGYPTITVFSEGEETIICSGYADLETLESRINQVIQQK